MNPFRPIRPALDPGFLPLSQGNVVRLVRPRPALACRWSVDANGRLRCHWERSFTTSEMLPDS